MFYSFEDKTPQNESDFVQNTDQSDIDENFSETISRRTRRNTHAAYASLEGDSKNYTVISVNNSDALYLSVKGVGDDNKFQIYIYDRTNSAASHLSAGPILVLIIGYIFMFKLFG